MLLDALRIEAAILLLVLAHGFFAASNPSHRRWSRYWEPTGAQGGHEAPVNFAFRVPPLVCSS